MQKYPQGKHKYFTHTYYIHLVQPNSGTEKKHRNLSELGVSPHSSLILSGDHGGPVSVYAHHE